MPKIPQYTAQQAPSGEIPAVKLPYSIAETGEGAKWAGLTELGGDVSYVAADIQRIKNEAELSKLERERNIKWESVWSTIQTTRDPVARGNLYKQFITDTASEAAKIKNNWVKRGYQLSLDRHIPEWTYHYNNISRRMDLEDAKVEIDLSRQTALEARDEVGYMTETDRALRAGLIGKAEAEQNKKDYPVNSVFAWSVKNMDKDPQAVIAELNALKDLTGEQVIAKNKLLRMAEQMNAQNGDELYKGVISSMMDADSKDLTPMEISQLSLDLQRKVLEPNNGLSGEQARVLRDYIKKWETGEDNIDIDALNSFGQRITNVNLGIEDPELLSDMQAAYSNGEFGRGKSAVTKYQRYVERMQNATMKLHAGTIKTLTKQFQEDTMDTVATQQFDFALHDMIATHPDWTTEQIYTEGMKLSASYQSISSDETIRAAMTSIDAINWAQQGADAKRRELEQLREGEFFVKESQWTKKDIVEARRILGDSEKITDEHIKQFEDYLIQKADVVLMKAPNGKRYNVNSVDVDEALQHGWAIE